MLFKKSKYLFLFVLLFFSCGKRESLTTFNDIYIYTSDVDKNKTINIIENKLFDYKFHTPEAEARYVPRWKKPEEFLEKPINPILMIISIKEFQDTTIDVISSLITSKIESKEKIILINDYLAKNQLLFILEYETFQEFENDISINKDWILKNIKEIENTKIKNYSFRSGLNDELIDEIEQKFFLKINIQKDYQLIKESDASIWIGRASPYRWLVILEDDKEFYQKPIDAWNRIDYQFEKILNIDIIPFESNFEIIEQKSRKLKKIKGVYGTKEDSENLTGGPFLSYFFENIESNKVIIVSGFVNSPGKSKVFHLKELEYIIETIEGI